MCTYVVGVFVQTRIIYLILIFASYYLLSGPGPVLCIIRMTRERHIILKAALHSRLAV